MSLAATQIGYAYEENRWAVQSASLKIETGQLIGIIGPNGSGKSTLLRLLSGILTAQTGDVKIKDSDIQSLTAEQLAREVSFLPQIVQPAFAFGCDEIVAQGRYPHLGPLGFLSKDDLKIIERSMEYTHTLEFKNRPLNELSGGERQRVLLASVLAQEAKFLLLDEPTSSLDMHHQHDVFSLLKKFAEQGLGIGVVVHDLNLAGHFCDRIVLMHNHEIVASGNCDEVLTEDLLAPVYGDNVKVTKNPLTGDPLISIIG